MFRILALILLLYQKGSLAAGNTSKNTSSALSSLEIKELFKIETILINNMEKYAEVLEQKLLMIGRETSKMSSENSQAFFDTEKYLGNPLKSFSLIRRLNADWKAWHKYLLKPVGTVFINAMENLLKQKPTYSNLKAAVEELYRLQMKYELKAGDLAKGLLNGRQYNASLTAVDTYSIGKELNEMGQHIEAMQWLETALRTSFDEMLYKQFYSMNTKTITEYYANMEGKKFKHIEDFINKNNR